MSKVPLPSPMLIAESPGLDFLNSAAGMGEDRTDWLHDGPAMLGWLAASGAIPLEVSNQVYHRAALDAVAAEARDLRAWFHGFVDVHHGAALDCCPSAILLPLNRVLARGAAFAVVAAGRGGRLTLRSDRDWSDPAALLQPIADAIATTICTADFAQIKTCEGAGCTLMFHDTTRRRARRWCSMAICGNRAKQIAHRARHKSG